jgi:hypothetical protein
MTFVRPLKRLVFLLVRPVVEPLLRPFLAEHALTVASIESGALEAVIAETALLLAPE